MMTLKETPTGQYVNLAFYHFFRVEGFVETLRKKIKRLCLSLDLKGTILVAREGVNCNVAGTPENIEKLKKFFQELTQEQSLNFKFSWSDYQPFHRMIVKNKKQVIPVDDPEIAPGNFTGPSIDPLEFKKWMDDGKDMVVLDTRNEFEVQIGTFEGAKSLAIENFRDFEKRLAELPNDWKKKPIVMFCTGGIRCEKASPLMIKHGFKSVYQLDGGILNYFEKVGGDHYRGDCFVFDRRVALNPKLEESEVAECFKCRHPVTAEEQKLETYKINAYCPYCYDKHKEAV